MYWMIFSLCTLLASVETLQGIFRAAVLVPKFGKRTSLRISAFSGSLLAFSICCVMVPRTGIASYWGLLLLGLFLAIFMAGFDVFIGKVVMKLEWNKIFRDFNPESGNYLSLLLIMLAFYPFLAMQLRGVW